MNRYARLVLRTVLVAGAIAVFGLALQSNSSSLSPDFENSTTIGDISK